MLQLRGNYDEIGIAITVSEVTLDMQGFTLSGGGTATDGVQIVNSGTTHVSVINGHFEGFVDDGLDAENVVTGSFENVHAIGNAGVGIYVGRYATLSNCTARGNGTGIQTFAVVIVRDCVSQQNEGVGISAGNGSTVRDCIATSNDSHGISIGNGSTALNNLAGNNGPGAFDAAGIRAAGTPGLNRVNGNTVIGNDRGIDLDSTQNVMIRNFATDNTTNYDVGVSNSVGPIAGLVGPSATTNPWANIEY